MPTNVMISLVVVVIAFALFFILSFRGVNLFLTVFACTTLVCLCTPDGLTSIFTTFLPSVGNMFQQFFLLYTIGGAFGFCLMESGLGSAMATHMIKVFGEKWIAVALFVITCLMMAAGVASYQYAVLAISLPVLKKLNMSRKVALAAMSAGAGSVAYGTLIGMPNALNIAPTTYLGTTTMAGPVISLICTAFSVAFIVGYLIFLTRRLKAKGEGFVTYDDDPKNDQDEASLPPAWKGYICVAAIIGLSLLFQAMGIAAIQATTYAQVLSILLLFLLVGTKYLAHPFETCVRGIQGSLIPVVFISIVVGYGTAVQATPVFSWLVEQVLSMDMDPYLLTFVAVNLLAGMTANGTGGVTLFMENFGSTILSDPTINLGALHRIASIAGSGFDSLPHNGAIAFQLSVFKLSYKDGYFQQFMMSVLVNLLAGLLAVILAIILY
ncbi:MAG TPA: hypothetical protein H9719_02470 [Candidatus Intestinimonas stercoravium]|nr:hypothetical protein [Candidatus Intestinimonas stercoravium]